MHTIAFHLIDENRINRIIDERYEVVSTLIKDVGFYTKLKEICANPYEFKSSDFDAFSLETIYNYIRLTHAHYINSRIPEIEQTLFRLRQISEDPVYSKLQIFFKAYSNRMVHHIEKEENGIIAYAKDIISGLPSTSFNLQDFRDEHQDIDSILIHLEELIQKIDNNPFNFSLLSLLSNQINLLQIDLFIHGKIEDEVFLVKLSSAAKKIF